MTPPMTINMLPKHRISSFEAESVCFYLFFHTIKRDSTGIHRTVLKSFDMLMFRRDSVLTVKQNLKE